MSEVTRSLIGNPIKIWEVRSTAVIVNKCFVRARTRQEAKDNCFDKDWEEVSSVSKLTANEAWDGAKES